VYLQGYSRVLGVCVRGHVATAGKAQHQDRKHYIEIECSDQGSFEVPVLLLGNCDPSSSRTVHYIACSIAYGPELRTSIGHSIDRH
jgi:hypothetical protein